MMRIVVDLEKRRFPDLTTFRPYFESIENAMKVWDPESEIAKIIRMDCSFLKIGIQSRQLKDGNRPETYHDILNHGKNFKN